MLNLTQMHREHSSWWERYLHRKDPPVYLAENVADYLANQASIELEIERWSQFIYDEDPSVVMERAAARNDSSLTRIILLYNLGITKHTESWRDDRFRIHDATGEKDVRWANTGIWWRCWQTFEQAQDDGLQDDDWVYRVILRDYPVMGMPHILAVEKRRGIQPAKENEVLAWYEPKRILS